MNFALAKYGKTFYSCHTALTGHSTQARSISLMLKQRTLGQPLVPGVLVFRIIVALAAGAGWELFGHDFLAYPIFSLSQADGLVLTEIISKSR